MLRALKPDRMPAALSALCERAMGAAYVNQEPFSAKALLVESSHATPIFFVLFPGYSPSAQIEAYAETGAPALVAPQPNACVHAARPDGVSTQCCRPPTRAVGRSVASGGLTIISMGQGQEEPAERVIDRYMKTGGWIVLDNLHLCQSWLPSLERKLEAAAEGAHSDFRCFFSAEPIAGAPHAQILPESLLQAGAAQRAHHLHSRRAA